MRKVGLHNIDLTGDELLQRGQYFYDLTDEVGGEDELDIIAVDDDVSITLIGVLFDQFICAAVR